MFKKNFALLNIYQSIYQIQKRHLIQRSWKKLKTVYRYAHALHRCITISVHNNKKMLIKSYLKVWYITIINRPYVSYPLLMRRSLRAWNGLMKAKQTFYKKVIKKCFKLWRKRIQMKYFQHLEANRKWQLKMHALIRYELCTSRAYECSNMIYFLKYGVLKI